MGMHLMRNSTVYLPPELRSPTTPAAARAEYYQILWPYLVGKWRKFYEKFKTSVY